MDRYVDIDLENELLQLKEVYECTDSDINRIRDIAIKYSISSPLLASNIVRGIKREILSGRCHPQGISNHFPIIQAKLDKMAELSSMGLNVNLFDLHGLLK